MHSGSPGTRNRSEDSHTSHHSHPHHYRYGASDPESGRSERHTEDSPSLVRISVDLLTGGKSITAVMDPLSTVLDLKQRINVRSPLTAAQKFSPYRWGFQGWCLGTVGAFNGVWSCAVHLSTILRVHEAEKALLM